MNGGASRRVRGQRRLFLHVEARSFAKMSNGSAGFTAKEQHLGPHFIGGRNIWLVPNGLVQGRHCLVRLPGPKPEVAAQCVRFGMVQLNSKRLVESVCRFIEFAGL